MWTGQRLQRCCLPCRRRRGPRRCSRLQSDQALSAPCFPAGTTFLATYWPAVVCLGALVGLFAVYRAPPLVQGVCVAAGAVVALLAAWLLQQASGRPVLQALSACIMLFSAVAASFGCRCSPCTAIAAAVPLACAGKRLTEGCLCHVVLSQGSCVAGDQGHAPAGSPICPLLWCAAGGACLTPCGAARLSQAAFLATVFYASAIAFERLAGSAPAWGSGVPTFTSHIATLAVALAWVAIPSRPFAILAEELLPEALYNTVGPSGVLSGECVAGRKPP